MAGSDWHVAQLAGSRNKRFETQQAKILDLMDVIYILLPVALVIVLIIIAIFFWAVRSDQFDDLEGPAHRILMDDDDGERKTTKKSPPSDSEKAAD